MNDEELLAICTGGRRAAERVRRRRTETAVAKSRSGWEAVKHLYDENGRFRATKTPRAASPSDDALGAFAASLRDAVAQALSAVAKAEPPRVHVNVPAPVVTVEPPAVTVSVPPPRVTVNVDAPAQGPTRNTVTKRDEQGRVVETETHPLDA